LLRQSLRTTSVDDGEITVIWRANYGRRKAIDLTIRLISEAENLRDKIQPCANYKQWH